MIISAFGDPGLHAAKTYQQSASQKQHSLPPTCLEIRYAIVCLTPRLKTRYVETAHAHGLASKVVAARVIPAPVADITRAKVDLKETLLAECLRAIVLRSEAELFEKRQNEDDWR